jgi:hypothetical protein
MRKLVIAAAAAAGTAFAAPASAATSLDSVDNGWYSPSEIQGPFNFNTFTGLNAGSEFRSFFVFNLSSAKTAKSISITFRSNGGFETDTGTETLGLFDYTGSISSLVSGTGGAAAFSDLGSGELLGLHSIANLNSNRIPEFTVILSSAFVSQFNSAIDSSDKRIALGGALQTIGSSATQGFWAQSSGISAARLNIELASAVPEPATWAMMLLGFGFVGGVMRSAKRKQKVAVSYA